MSRQLAGADRTTGVEPVDVLPSPWEARGPRAPERSEEGETHREGGDPSPDG
ncbi:MAG: hypothetical protein U0V56_12700 [Actinomycetota bacterium]